MRIVSHIAQVTLILALTLILTLAACAPLSTVPTPTPNQPPEPASGTLALNQLDTLPVAAWHPMAGYSRDLFPHWLSQGNGCDTREIVLKRQGANVVTNSNCTPTAGTWISAYDGKTITDPHAIDVDHVVPLANAWRTGADTWTTERRGEFANDLDHPQLIAVTASQNRAKGDQDPAEWRPASRAFWCEYAQDWIAVKKYWNLFVTSAEKTALVEMLGTC